MRWDSRRERLRRGAGRAICCNLFDARGSMTTTCLINNYNYAEFLGAAIDSALAQTVPFDQIVVVDDGSTDGSLDVVAKKRALDPVIQVVAKANQGQLSCFNEGAARARGDIV